MLPIETFRAAAEPFAMYTLTPTHLLVPRYYGLEHFGPAERDATWRGAPLPVERCAFVGTLSAEQRVAVDAIAQRFRGDGAPRGGLLVLPCGFGKTVVAIYVAAALLRVKTLVLVHKQGLLEQWCARIRTFAPGLTVGTHKQQHLDADCDVLVAMIQTVARRTYARGELRDRGLVVVDECHHLGAPVFGSAMAKLGCAYTLGLSATPERKDGLTRILYMTVGPLVHRVEREKEAVLVTSVRAEPCAALRALANADGRPQYAVLVNAIADDAGRSALIAAHVARLVHAGRVVIVLSERITQLQDIETVLVRDGGVDAVDIGYYVGRSTASERARCAACAVTLSTLQMAREGLDQPRLDCLVLASPCSDVVQAVGRIQRTRGARETPPLVLDVVDGVSIFESMARKRMRFYRASGFTVQREGDVQREELFS